MNRRNVLILCLTTVFVLLSVIPADAFIFKLFRRRRTRSVSVSVNVSGNAQQVCQQKANIMAKRGRAFHVGGSFAGCRYEGVARARTAQQALNWCCYSGMPGSKRPRKTPVAAATAYSNGWYYACRLYR